MYSKIKNEYYFYNFNHIITMMKLMFMIILNTYLTYIYTFSTIPFKLHKSKLLLNCNSNNKMLNIHNAFLQNITKISYETMIEKNRTINNIYILYNYDLLIKDHDNNLYLYNNVNRTNIFYDFNCGLSFISLKYMYLIISKQF